MYSLQRSTWLSGQRRLSSPVFQTPKGTGRKTILLFTLGNHAAAFSIKFHLANASVLPQAGAYLRLQHVCVTIKHTGSVRLGSRTRLVPTKKKLFFRCPLEFAQHKGLPYGFLALDRQDLCLPNQIISGHIVFLPFLFFLGVVGVTLLLAINSSIFSQGGGGGDKNADSF